MTTSTARKEAPLGDEEVAEWLKANPEFFRRNAAGGTAVFLDTGAGKGGHLSWLDLPAGGAAMP